MKKLLSSPTEIDKFSEKVNCVQTEVKWTAPHLAL